MSTRYPSPSITGIVLAAGAGRRFGHPKALAVNADGEPWLELATRTLLDAGCGRVIVVLGAAAETANALLPRDSRVESVVAEDWATGMSASVRAGLERAGSERAGSERAGSERAGSERAGSVAPPADAVLITLVDLPGLPVDVLLRVLDHAIVSRGDLRRATFGSRPGHPVLIGRDHWAPLAAQLETVAHSAHKRDSGARGYLIDHGVTEIECGDLFSGDDIDARPTPGGGDLDAQP